MSDIKRLRLMALGEAKDDTSNSNNLNKECTVLNRAFMVYLRALDRDVKLEVAGGKAKLINNLDSVAYMPANLINLIDTYKKTKDDDLAKGIEAILAKIVQLTALMDDEASNFDLNLLEKKKIKESYDEDTEEQDDEMDFKNEGRTIETVERDVRSILKRDNADITQKSEDIQTIVRLKEKRNKLKGSKKQEYQDYITELEKTYKSKYKSPMSEAKQRHASFDLSEMPVKDWKNLLKELGASETPKRHTKGYFLWEGDDIEITTCNNPITGEYYKKDSRDPEKNYLSYVGVTGDNNQVELFLMLFKSTADYKDENLTKREFV